MKNIIAAISLVVLGFMLQGCPFESAVPIDQPSIKINPALLGTWFSRDDGGNKHYEVTQKDAYHYSIRETDGSQDNFYEAYLSDVSGASFINLRALQQDSDKNFVFYKLTTPSSNELTLSEITDNVDEVFSSSADLKKFIKSNMKNSYFYGRDEIHLIRK